MSRRARVPRARVPTSLTEKGVPYFTEADLTGANGPSLHLLPSGDVPLLVFPSAPKGSAKEYSGDPTPVTCYLVDTQRYYRCRHVMNPPNKETGESATICQHTWMATQSVTPGTI